MFQKGFFLLNMGQILPTRIQASCHIESWQSMVEIIKEEKRVIKDYLNSLNSLLNI